MTILFDIFPATGHYNASFVIADHLRSLNYRVIYCIEKGFEKIVERRGFEYLLVNRPLYSDAIEFRNKGFVFWFNCLRSIFTHNRQEFFHKNVSDFEAIVKKVAPDFVVLDSQFILKSIIYHHLCIPLVSLETKPLSLYDPWVPPFTSKHIPRKTIFSKLIIFLSWQKIVFGKKIRNAIFLIMLFGNDYYSLYQKLAIKYHFPYREKIDWKRPFVMGFKNIEILSMTPSSFDFPRKYPPQCYYAESRVDLNREKIILNKRYIQVIEKVGLLKQQQPNIKIIYCSLGSTSGFKKRSKTFFQKIRTISKRNPQYVFILSVGIRYNTTYFIAPPI